jgi:hypothetical protein
LIKINSKQPVVALNLNRALGAYKVVLKENKVDKELRDWIDKRDERDFKENLEAKKAELRLE